MLGDGERSHPGIRRNALIINHNAIKGAVRKFSCQRYSEHIVFVGVVSENFAVVSDTSDREGVVQIERNGMRWLRHDAVVVGDRSGDVADRGVEGEEEAGVHEVE